MSIESTIDLIMRAEGRVDRWNAIADFLCAVERHPLGSKARHVAWSVMHFAYDAVNPEEGMPHAVERAVFGG